jgi:hypothetical protein
MIWLVSNLTCLSVLGDCSRNISKIVGILTLKMWINMNPINIICPGCGRDMLIEPEVMEDDEATCPMCGAWLHDEEAPYEE